MSLGSLSTLFWQQLALVKAGANGWKPNFDCTDYPYSGEKLVAWCLTKLYDAQVGAAAGYRLLLIGTCMTVRSSGMNGCQQQCPQVSLSVQHRPQVHWLKTMM